MNKIEKYSKVISEFNALADDKMTEFDIFLKRYSAFVKSIENERFNEFQKKSADLFTGFANEVDKYEEANRGIAEGFNVFKILKIERKEVITHSPIIAHLLDPMGTHAQKDLFYNMFLQTVISDEKIIGRFKNLHYKQYKTETERGKMDITIRSRNPENPFIVIIENKIDYIDRENQIQNYYQKARREYNTDNIMFIYLSINREKPDEVSIRERDRVELEDKGLFYSITYKNEIKDWLIKSKEMNAAPIVNYTIEQYLKTIKLL